jgi:hypothetical protein
MPNRSSVLIFLLTLAACGGTTEQPTGGAGGAGGGGTGTGAGDTGGTSTTTTTTTFTGESFTVTFDPVTVQPGEEKTQCVLKRLDNPSAIHVGTIHNELGPGSHHLIVYKTSDTVEQPTPFNCQPFTDLLNPAKGSPLMITQKKDDVLTLPKGVAFGIEAAQMVRLEMHYINTTSSPVDVTAKSTFYSMDEAEFENEADFLFFGNPDINIAPQSAATLGPTYLPLPSMLEGSKFFGFTGHEHHWGTGVTIGIAPSKGAPATMVYDEPNWNWAEPPTVYKDPPLDVPQGGGFNITCKWQNNSPDTVKFGESANDEMCFFWTYYYPSKGAFVCAHSDQVAGGIDLCCPGHPACSFIF